MPERRRLQFEHFADIIAELDRLERAPYQALGKWNLAQICEHCNHYLRGSLDGFPFKIPLGWLIRNTLGRSLKRKWLTERAMKPGMMTAPQTVPTVAANDPKPIAESRELLRRAQTTTQWQPSPFLGTLTPAEWETLHCVHFGHHLGFLIPQT